MSAATLEFEWNSLLGESLVNKAGEVAATQSALSGKVVGLYFSAHWCPPCRSFTPQLIRFYEETKNKHPNFEIVFISGDDSKPEFANYFKEMPWLAVPHDNREIQKTLSRKFNVQSIPTFVVLSPNGTLNTTDGRSKVRSAPEKFPWNPTTLSQDLGTSFTAKDGSQKTVDSDLAGKYIGLYFSAHWCPPCKRFTPKLVKFYNDRKAAGKDDFEVVFCSSDNEEVEFKDYYGEMPWLSLPFKDARRDALSERFGVDGIPSLVILAPDRSLVTVSAVDDLMADPEGKLFPFIPKYVKDLAVTTESFGRDLNNCKSLVAFVDALDDAAQEDINKKLDALAKTLTTDGNPSMIFFLCNRPSYASTMIRSLTETSKKSEPFVVVLDITDDGAYYLLENCDIEAEGVIDEFVRNIMADTATRLQMKNNLGEEA